MSDFDNTNRGSIWKNDKKETETQPDFTGSLNVNGEDFWVSAWRRKPDANPKAPALSFSIKPKEEKAMPKFSSQAKSSDPFKNAPDFGNTEPDDDLGF